jgi:hypothetical protein
LVEGGAGRETRKANLKGHDHINTEIVTEKQSPIFATTLALFPIESLLRKFSNKQSEAIFSAKRNTAIIRKTTRQPVPSKDNIMASKVG